MCGINGIWQTTPPSPDALKGALKAMSEVLHHRGPDASGTWEHPSLGVGFGHRRLSIVDLSPSGAQPMASECGRYVIAFNGEIYNHRALRAELEREGQKFRGTSDTEVLLALIGKYGVSRALELVVGMFAFALWDESKRSLTLARDRVGEKPLYVGLRPGQLIFASELKSLRQVQGFEFKVHDEAFALFVRHGYVPAPFSIYEGVKKLNPGTFLTFAEEDVAQGTWPKPVTYWRLNPERMGGLKLGLDEATWRLKQLIEDSIRDQMVADVPVGCFLSGGIDSSTVTAVMQSLSSRPIKTFSIGFTESGYNEAEYARRIAQHLGTDHTELYVTPLEARQVIPHLADIYDEPFADSSQIPTFLVAKLAREQVTVSLSGDAGDELFGGYNRYTVTSALWERIKRLPLPLRKALARTLEGTPMGALRLGLGALKPLMPEFMLSGDIGEKLKKGARVLRAGNIDEVYLEMISIWGRPESVLKSGLRGLNPIFAEMGVAGDEILNLQYKDFLTYLPDDILVKVDRATMAVSLESRVPLLDHRIIEFAFSLAPSVNISGGVGKLPLRSLLSQYVPREMFERPKMGFGIPVGDWLKGDLRDWAESLLDPALIKSQGFLNSDVVERMWSDHLSGRRNWQHQLWVLLMLQSWLARWR